MTVHRCEILFKCVLRVQSLNHAHVAELWLVLCEIDFGQENAE